MKQNLRDNPPQIKLLETTKADIWASEFQRIVVDTGIEIDERLMVVWFSDAMTAQRDADAAAPR